MEMIGAEGWTWAVQVNKYFGRGFRTVKPEKSDLIFNRGWTRMNADGEIRGTEDLGEICKYQERLFAFTTFCDAVPSASHMECAGRAVAATALLP